jgi:hypothetical protein
MASPPLYMTISISKNHTIKQSKAKIIRLHSVSLNQGSAEKDSIQIHFFEKSHDFRGKLDFLNFGKQ